VPTRIDSNVAVLGQLGYWPHECCSQTDKPSCFEQVPYLERSRGMIPLTNSRSEDWTHRSIIRRAKSSFQFDQKVSGTFQVSLGKRLLSIIDTDLQLDYSHLLNRNLGLEIRGCCYRI